MEAVEQRHKYSSVSFLLLPLPAKIKSTTDYINSHLLTLRLQHLRPVKDRFRRNFLNCDVKFSFDIRIRVKSCKYAGKAYGKLVIQLIGEKWVGKLAEVHFEKGTDAVNVLDKQIFRHFWNSIFIKRIPPQGNTNFFMNLSQSILMIQSIQQIINFQIQLHKNNCSTSTFRHPQKKSGN